MYRPRNELSDSNQRMQFENHQNFVSMSVETCHDHVITACFHLTLGKIDSTRCEKSEKVSSNTKKWIRFILDRFRFLLSSISGLKFALFEFFISKSREIFNDKKHICYIFSNNRNVDNVLLVQSNFIYFIILLYYFFREEFRIFLNNNVIEE